ncbi:MAG: OmpA family protein [Bacteroidota bacterium]
MGGYDIYKSVKDEDGLWSEPENLGSPVNSIADDIYFVLSANGKRGYFSSNRKGGIGGADIYVTNMPYQPGFLIVIKGKINSFDSQEPIKATITVIDNITKELQGIYNSNAATGKFLMVVSPKRKYKMLVEAGGYYPYTDEYFVISHIDTFAILSKEIQLEPIIKEKEITVEYIYSYTLENVYFHIKEHELLPESYDAFTTLIRAMIANPKMKIEIAGHTDNVGDHNSNMILSQERAEAVREYLISRGIAEERMIARGYGETLPLASNDTEEGRAENRRTEIRIIEE